ncbi:Scr1 family TA system antitoxin-like transcriptional regulator [Nocardiopsis sp. Huas11]|uniref:Scr1 family TA system antitoxin-like transcriptional regulator n=1 Tax=Nocardiopsis sp. Huas11 TaxID=2183912 RepID=UPI001315ACBC|nr:Scr1 family TA system antitoxin-like transcriptional regulator [Nocardiopsis sp. Huas11]
MVNPLGFPAVLARYLELSGLTQRALCARAQVSPASLSRYLSGKTRPSRGAVTALDMALGANSALLTAWEDSVTDDLPPFLRDIDTLEREAVRIDLVSPVTVPGLLWCPSYAELVYRSGRKVRDVPRLARLRSERLGHLHGEVHAVFPLTALTWAPDSVRAEQVEHLLNLPDRVSVHLLPEGTLLFGVPGPFSLFRMHGGREVASSDHLEANAVYGDAVLPRVRELVRDAYALALPAMTSNEQLRRLAS